VARARKGSRLAIAVAASAVVHLALVAVVMVSLPRQGPPPEPRSFEVALTTLPPPLLRRPRPSARAAASPALARPPVPALSRPSETPQPAASAAQAPSSGEDQEGLAKLRGVLRGSVGCSEARFLHLTQEELDRCARLLQAHLDPDRAIPAPIAPEKRAWFEASLAAYASPSHPPGVFCGMLIDGVRLVKPKAPPHALKAGGVPCYVTPPKFSISEEADIETPSRQTAQRKALEITPKALVTSDGGFAPGRPY
jgi:hypothetical protein